MEAKPSAMEESEEADVELMSVDDFDASESNPAKCETNDINALTESKESGDAIPDLEDPASSSVEAKRASKDGDGGAEAEEDAHDEDSPPLGASPEDLLLSAVSCKESGNNAFKVGDLATAARHYRKGANQIKKINQANTGDDQVKQLLLTLHSNLSMVCFKQKKHKMSRDAATKALEIDPNHVKALYRRGVAHRALGDLDSAKNDLKKAFKTDPTNISVKKELVGIRKQMEEAKAKEKANLQRAFSKTGSSLLYSDKEEAEKKRALEKEEKQKREAEELKKRKQYWEDDCVRRMSSDPPEEAISFEDWDKERKEVEKREKDVRDKAEKAEKERKRQEQQNARKAERALAAANNKENGDDSGDELSERELAALRGYKKTSDGRTTSYFNREQTEKEKELIGCIKPKLLTAPSPSNLSTPSSGPTPLGRSAKVGSVWNQSGTTWEEKDTTEWCKTVLEKCLLDTATAYFSTTSSDTTYVAMVKKVKDMTGDASVALAGGKKRYIYDFHLSADFEILNDANDVVASGSLILPDINSATTAEEELEVDIGAWNQAPNSDNEGGRVVSDAVECRKLLVSDVRKSVLKFVEQFNSQF